MILINDLSLPAPASLSVKIEPRTGVSQYNTLGQLVQDGVREKRTVEIAWTRMAAATLNQLAALLSPGGFFSLSYPDPLSGARVMSCRVMGQSARVCQYRNGAPLWADVQLILEEQ